MRPSIQQRVQNGVTLLDKVKPGWRKHINPAILNMGDPLNCVLGQLFGSYIAGRCAVEMGDAGSETVDMRADHGFTMYRYDDYDDVDPGYEELTTEWRKQLHK